MAGRKPKWTTKQVIDAIYEANGIVTEAARILGCDRGTIYDRAKRNKKVKAAMDDANDAVLDKAEGCLIGLIDSIEHKDHFSAVRYLLRTKGRKRGYGDRTDVVVAKGSLATRDEWAALFVQTMGSEPEGEG